MLNEDGKLLIGVGETPVCLLPRMANRHGLISGATGTGKTITLKVMAESFSALGVPVFLADVKGDLAGCCRTGERTEAIDRRLTAMGLDPETFRYQPFPVRFWDVYGEMGHPRAHDRQRDGRAPALPSARSDRRAGGRADHRIPRCG